MSKLIAVKETQEGFQCVCGRKGCFYPRTKDIDTYTDIWKHKAFSQLTQKSGVWERITANFCKYDCHIIGFNGCLTFIRNSDGGVTRHDCRLDYVDALEQQINILRTKNKMLQYSFYHNALLNRDYLSIIPKDVLLLLLDYVDD